MVRFQLQNESFSLNQLCMYYSNIVKGFVSKATMYKDRIKNPMHCYISLCEESLISIHMTLCIPSITITIDLQ